ncbi:hypothetical protein KAT24_02015 [Candidatus Pacearchaeota archaeon]|nr:hypothetical protein [Candidatus Pacearchaeota archaeon]
MTEVMGSFTAAIIEIYNTFISSFPAWAQNFVNLFFLMILVFLYSFFIWKFYRFIAKKNIFGFDLNKYNKSSHPFLAKLFAGGFYFLEYIIILPFIIFFWFTIFTFFLILLTDSLEVGALLTVAAIIVAVVRLSCYYKEDLAKDLAKLLPFTLLAIALLNQNFFNFERILSHFSALPSFFNKIIIYLVFIIGLEIILRFFDFIFSLFGLEEVGEEVSEQETNESSS